jgi:hypothetical protein
MPKNNPAGYLRGNKKKSTVSIGGGVAAPTPNSNAAQSGKKMVPAGFKNYGQFRKTQVHSRNAARKAAKLASGVAKKYKRPKKGRYGDTQTVDSATAKRTLARMKRTGFSAGIDTSDGISGAEARAARSAAHAKRVGITAPNAGQYNRRRKRPTYSIPPRPGR